MSFESIKNGFITFLNGKLINEERQGKDVEFVKYGDDMSLFMHANEFKDYISDKLDTGDIQVSSKSVAEILDMEVVGGKLVDPEAEKYDEYLDEEDGMFEKTTETDDAESNGVQQTDRQPEQMISEEDITVAEGEEGESAGPLVEPPPVPEGFEDGAIPDGEGDASVVDILNDFFGNQKVIDSLDTDASGDLSAEEIQTFISDIAGFDGESADISLDDILTSMDLINDEDYVPGDITKNIDVNNTDIKPVEDNDVSTGEIEPSASSGGSSSGGGGVNIPGIIAPIKGLSRSKNNTQTDTTDLKENLSIAKSELKDKQNDLDNINSGKDEKLQKIENQVNNAYEVYQSALKAADKNLAAEIFDIESQIADKQIALDKTSNNIFDLKNEISNSQTTFDSAENNSDVLNGLLSELLGKDTKNYTDEQQSDLKSKISDLKDEIKVADEAEDKSKEVVKSKKKRLSELQDKEEKLKKEIEDLKLQKTEKENNVENYPDAKKAMDAYHDAQKVRDEYKADAIKTAQNAVIEAQNKVNEAQSELDKAETENKKKEFDDGKSRLPVNLFRQGSLYGKEDMVADAAERHGIEPELLAGIICLESGYGSSYYCNNNFNPGGTTGSGNAGYTVRSSDGFHFAKYNSIEDGVEAMASNLESYKSRFNIAAIDINHIYEIGSHYCNSDWSRAVSALYQALKEVE